MQVRNDDPVPAGITRNFHQRMLDTQRRGASDYARAEPTGADRYRFAGRPRNPGLRDDMPNVVLSELNNRLDPITANKVLRALNHCPSVIRFLDISRSLSVGSS